MCVVLITHTRREDLSGNDTAMLLRLQLVPEAARVLGLCSADDAVPASAH
jgi:hypothetical protein